MCTIWWRSLAVRAALACVLLVSVPATGSAWDGWLGGGGFAARIAGSYLIRHDDSSNSRDVMTIGADGTFLDASSAAGAEQFGEAQGAWKRTGRWTIAAKAVDFDYDDKAVAVIRFTITFDRRLNRVWGEFSGALYDEEIDDPLDTTEDPIRTFSNSFTGRRITVD